MILRKGTDQTMAAKKKPAAKNNRGPSRTATAQTAAQREQTGKAKRQAGAVLLFAASVFLLFLVLIRGENVWFYMHAFLFGLFGLCTYLLPVVLCYISLMLAFDRLYSNIRLKIVEA